MVDSPCGKTMAAPKRAEKENERGLDIRALVGSSSDYRVADQKKRR
jgi:hypothetical protein